MRYKTTNVLQLTKIVRQKMQEDNLFSSNKKVMHSGNKTEGTVWVPFDFNQQNLLITFSGGQDSAFCLLVLYLLENKRKFAWNRINLYTVLWCNHFWQRDSFFTMEHVSKLTFCKNYAIYLFASIKQVLSEQNARNWRHKAIQRSSSFLRRTPKGTKTLGFNKVCNYEFIELHINSVLIIRPQLFLCYTQTKTRADYPCSGYPVFELRCIASLPKATKINITSYKNSVLILQKPSWSGTGKQVSSKRSDQLCVQGHNKSDRAEAILFNLIRGTGINGVSTLQWKHAFPSGLNCNHTFYPKLSDFFKEIRILFLDSLFFKSCRQKRIKLCVPCSSLTETKFWFRYCVTLRCQAMQKLRYTRTELCKNGVMQKRSYAKTPFLHNPVPRQICVAQQSCASPTPTVHLKAFYYQLKYQLRAAQ